VSRLWRNTAVLILASVAIFFSVSDIVVPWHPYGVLGFVLRPDARVVYVKPQSQVAQAGIRVGDRVDLNAISQSVRAAFNGTVIFGAVGTRHTL